MALPALLIPLLSKLLPWITALGGVGLYQHYDTKKQREGLKAGKELAGEQASVTEKGEAAKREAMGILIKKLGEMEEKTHKRNRAEAEEDRAASITEAEAARRRMMLQDQELAMQNQIFGLSGQQQMTPQDQALSLLMAGGAQMRPGGGQVSPSMSALDLVRQMGA